MKLFINLGLDENDAPNCGGVSITVGDVVHTLTPEHGAIVVDCPADDIAIAETPAQ